MTTEDLVDLSLTKTEITTLKDMMEYALDNGFLTDMDSSEFDRVSKFVAALINDIERL